MKRLIAVILICVMFSCYTAFAEFNIDVFDGIDNVTTDIDDMEGTASIMMTDVDAFGICAYDSTIGGSIYTTIAIVDGTALFAINCDLLSKTAINLDTMIIKIGDHRYFFDNLNYAVTDLSGLYEVKIMIVMDSITETFAKDFIEAYSCDEDIKIRLKGDNYSADCFLSCSAKYWIATFFEKYIEGGGYDSENMDKIPSCSFMTVK